MHTLKTLRNWGLVFLIPLVVLACLGGTAHPALAQVTLGHIGTSGSLLFAGITLNSNIITLADWAKRLDPDGRVAKVVELLSQTNQIFQDAHWEQGNLPTGNRTAVRTGLPGVFWRLLNRGVPTGKSTTSQVDEMAGMLEARGQVDVDLAALNADVAAFRLSEAQPFVEAMSQEFTSVMFYGSAASPEEFVGLAPRYSSLAAPNARNILDGGGTGADNMSIWLIVWGPNTIFNHFPKGTKAGIVHEDLGIGDAFDENNNRFRAYLDRWQIKGGASVKDWRYAVRICNIDASDLVAGTGADLVKLMSKAYHRIQNYGMGRASWYMNRTAIEYLDIQRQEKVSAGGGITWQNVDGKVVPTFRGIPIGTCDSLLETEARVV